LGGHLHVGFVALIRPNGIAEAAISGMRLHDRNTHRPTML